MRTALVVSMVLGCATAWGAPESSQPEGFHALAIGESAPDFKLPGVDGRDYALADFADAKLLLVIFTCNHCPTAQAYEDRIIQLDADYKSKGVKLIAISPNDPRAVRLDELGYTDLSDSLEDMKQRAKDKNFSFPYLYDGETQSTALAYGVVATPQVFLFDGGRKLRYMGRIDDSDVRTVTSHDTRSAIDALLAGESVPVETTRIFGCSTKWAAKRALAAESLAKWDQEPVTLETIDPAGIAKLAKNETDKLLVVNVWATWCGPCVAELPEFVTINRMFRKRPFQLVTLSIDEPDQQEAAEKLLKGEHVALTNYLAVSDNRDKVAEALDHEWQGPVPYTLIIAPGGEVLYRHAGGIEPLAVKRLIADKLGRTYGAPDSVARSQGR